MSVNNNNQFDSPATNSQSDISFNLKYENPNVPQHGVNIVIGGAMISGTIIMLFVICYCCHRNYLQKRENHLNNCWREPAILTSDIFTIDGAQLIEVTEYQVEDSSPSSPGPPPPYESIVDRAPPYERVVDIDNDFENEAQNRRKIRRWSSSQAVVVPVDDSEPPSYECALKLQNGTHI